VGNRLELVKTPAKKVTDASGERKINQSQHSQFLADLPPAPAFVRGFILAGISANRANRNRSFFFVKHLRISAPR
jgi:hypothetical protein